ncbi:MAG: hypothetical protein H7Z14_14585 [Anaerolineae bacterium]|nr:hypothetical protein [Phycisphaerae bacterium]
MTLSRDPEKSLLTAQRSLRLLGIISALFGLVMIVAFGYLNRSVRFRPYFIAMGFLVWFLPGVLMVMCWWYLNRRNRIALRLALVMCAVQTLFAIALFAMFLVLTPISPVPIVMTLLWALAAVQLLTLLWRARPAVDLDAEHHAAFEPQMILTAARAEDPAE